MFSLLSVFSTTTDNQWDSKASSQKRSKDDSTHKPSMLWLQPNRCFTISHDWKPLTPQQHSIADRFHILPLCQIVTLSIFYQFTRQALTPQQHHIANRFCILPLRHASILYSCAWTKLQLPNSIPNPIDYIYSHCQVVTLYFTISHNSNFIF